MAVAASRPAALTGPSTISLRRADLASVIPAFRTLGQAVAVWMSLIDIAAR
jgi:hypothetical protein